MLRAHGVEQGRPGRGRPPSHPRDRGDLLRHLEARRDPALDVGALRRRRDPPPAHRLDPEAADHRRGQRARASTPRWSTSSSSSTRATGCSPASPPTTSARTPPPTTRRSSTTRPAPPARRRASSTPTATSSPTRSSSTATTSATASASTAWASGPGRRASPPCSARGASARSSTCSSARPASSPPTSSTSSPATEVTNVFTTPTAMRAMMAIDDAGERYPQEFRIVCSAGEPLNPEAIRWFREQYGVTVLDYYGLTESYPLCANFPFMEVREGSMGRPMPGWDVQILDEDENPVAQGERGEICLRARSNPHYPLGYWNLPEASRGDLRRRLVPHQGRGDHGRGRLRLVRGPRRRRDHRRRLPDRPVRGRVGLHRAPGGPRGRRGRLARRGQGQRGQGVHRPRRGPRALRRARQARSRASSASGSAPTPTRGGSSSPTSCRRR